MIRRPPRPTRTATRFPYTTLFRSSGRWILGIIEQNQPKSPVLGLLASHWTLRPSPSGAGRPTRWDERWRTVLPRSEEHTSELQSLMRISYAVFCLKKKNTQQPTTIYMYYCEFQIHKSKLIY